MPPIIMKILIFAKPGARRIEVKEMPIPMQGFHACFSVAVRERAQGGEANQAIVRAVAEHLGVPFSSLRIVSGHTSRRKIIVQT